ncbi:hypothetical protein GGD38_007653 [Chitinophagaceae bacterium OAS944]|nr:hypothetical protein [Chitinophagaceae bacterium OAS944]
MIIVVCGSLSMFLRPRHWLLFVRALKLSCSSDTSINSCRFATKSLDELKRYLIIAMYESGGWDNNYELNNLYHNLKAFK